MTDKNKVRNALIKQIKLLLGDGMIDIELDPDHYDLAIDIALSKIRQRSENAVEEDFYNLQLINDVAEYTLPDEVIEVRQVYNRSFGTGISSGRDMDPFELAYSNSFLFAGGGLGGLATYEFFAQYRETLNRISATDVGFIWNSSSKILKILKRMRADENVILHVFTERGDDQLMEDRYLKSWVRDYAVAMCKKMIGEARSKFSSLPSGSGGVTLNGTEMKNEADAILEKLEADLANYIDGSAPLGFTIG